MIHSKENYIMHVRDIIKTKGSEMTEAEFELLYNAAQGMEINTDKFILVEKAVNYIFKTPFSNEIYLPWNFFSTPVGEVIAAVKFGTEQILFVQEMAELYNCNTSYIYRQIKKGNLKAQVRSGVYIISVTDADVYLKERNKPTVAELRSFAKNKYMNNFEKTTGEK